MKINPNTTMNYMEEVEREFREKLAKGGEIEPIVQWVKQKVLQSYRNGQRSRSKIGKGRQPEPAQAS